MSETCQFSQHIDGHSHGWQFSGDDPYVVCCWCHETRDALTDRVIDMNANHRVNVPGLSVRCNNCGGQNKSEMTYCPACGTAVNQSTHSLVPDPKDAEIASLREGLAAYRDFAEYSGLYGRYDACRHYDAGERLIAWELSQDPNAKLRWLPPAVQP